MKWHEIFIYLLQKSKKHWKWNEVEKILNLIYIANEIFDYMCAYITISLDV